MKKHIKLLFRTLISNNACVEAARTPELKYNIIAIILVLFSLFFAGMPTCVTGFQQQGGAWIRGTTYAFDTAMMDFGKVAQQTKLTFTINDNHTLRVSDEWKTNPAFHQEDIKKFPTLYRFTSWSEDDPETNVVDKHKILEIYFCSADKNYTKYVTNVLNNINPESNDDDKEEDTWLETETVINPKTKKEETVKKARSTSFIVFGSKNIQGALFQPELPAVASSIAGDYHHIKPGNIIPTLFKANDPAETLKMSAKFFDKVFIDTRWANTWRSTGIILAVDTGVVLLMGFMVWVLTRGRNNPFRIYTLWDGQKIAYYACLTPGILALFGFLLKNMAMMFFILFTGVRVMWLSMRTLRYQAPAK